MAATGKAIFDKLVQYPLPPPASGSGVKDFVFFVFKDATDEYRGAAYDFFVKHYPAHERHDVATLEALIATLHSAIANGVKQIREIVIVAHANPLGMIIPVVSPSESSNADYKYLTLYSLASLQQDFKAGHFPTFKSQRTDVLAHLEGDARVTIRACNIGQNNEFLYALYSFFGGRPDVYAPTKYQLFGYCPMVPGSRIADNAGVYTHLVKQHFLPTDEHTPDRRDALAGALVDPGSYAAPFVLATKKTDGTAIGDYQTFVAQLNAKTISPALRTAFSNAGYPLSSLASVSVNPKSGTWLVTDLINKTIPYSVHYEISEVEDAGADTTSLTTSAQIQVKSAKPSLVIQLFLDDGEDDDFKGKLFFLAGYADGGVGNSPKLKQEFDAAVHLLGQASFTDDTVDIKAKFASSNAGITLSATASISTVASGANPVWRIKDGAAAYLVKQEIISSSDRFPAHVLTVYQDLDKAGLAAAHNDVLEHKGTDPDTPGTELATYLDQYTIDELADFVAYLRSGYQAMNAFFINHAAQAIQRKREYGQWAIANIDTKDVLSSDAATLNRRELDDLRDTAYAFDFNSVWNEVKVSSRYVVAFQNDLFIEEDLTQKFGPTAGPAEISADSPSASRESLRQAPPGLEPYFAVTGKSVFTPPDEPDTMSCGDFGDVLTEWKSLLDAGKKPEEIQAAMEELKNADNESYWELFKKIYETVKFPFEFSELAYGKIEIGEVEIEFPDLNKYILEEVGEHVGWLADPIEVTFEIAPALTIPWDLWKDTLEAQEKADEVSEIKGKIVAIRQWMRELIALTEQDPFPAHPTIDLGGPAASWQRFDDELIAEGTFIGSPQDLIGASSPEDLQKGFSEGLELMDQIGPEFLAKADEVASEALDKIGLDPCKAKKLKDVGLLDLDKLRAKIVGDMARAVLNQGPLL